ncbi:MAG: carboxypeptidase regulatory-like domain-containing protein, partial [Anaerolineae bacterium]|nr:carboxypeptidase regulatory-like domain-containing protein [Anaerolineae bacterium]
VMFDGKAPDSATLDVKKRIAQSWQTVASYSTTNHQPFNYAIHNLPPDIYALQVQASYQGINYRMIYKDALDFDHALPVTVTAGVSVSSLNFVMGEVGNLISGTVTTPEKQPLANIQVTAYVSRTYGWQVERTTLTDPTGAYQMRALSPDHYVLGFRDPNGMYSDGYYPGAPLLAQATPITLSLVTRLTNLDVELPLVGRIAGRLTLFDGTSLADIKLTVYAQLDGYHSAIRSQTFSQQYEIAGLRAGTYRLQASTGFNFTEYYDGVLNLAEATDIMVTSGTTTRNIDIVLGRSSTYAMIEGKVTTSDNKPLANIKVNAYATSATGSPARSTTTDQTGAYQLSQFKPGIYVVCFEDQAQLYLPECYNQAPAAQATLIVLKDHDHFANANATLSAAGSIIGNVINLSAQPLSTSSITVYTKDNFGWKNFASTSIYSVPHYVIPGLPAGIYRVRFSSSDPSLEQYYTGVTDISNATDVTVTSGVATPNINFVVGTDVQNAQLEGRVTNKDTALAGVRVELYYKRLNQDSWSSDNPLVYTFTDGNGQFKLAGLGEGDYRLRFSDPNGAFASIYYGSAFTFADAAVLTLGSATVRTDVNMDLSQLVDLKYAVYLPLVGR